jgi:glucose/arabinose dehydrogenase
VRAVATGLDTPWGLAFAPDGRLFFTERPGRVRVIEDGVLQEEPLVTLEAEETAEGGVMGLAVDPDFPDSPYLYAKYSYRSGGEILNRVVRLRVEGNSATEDAVLLDGIPGANTHNGGRVKVGPDGKLYVTTGDAQRTQLSQDPDSLAGKILRMELDGSVPEDNPFPGSVVYSLGHRNPQGLAWHPETGLLYATEHGPVGNDEVNLIEAGENYGWPEVQGEEHGQYRGPIAVYSPAIAPAGAAFYEGEIQEWRGSLFFANLRGTHLHRLQIDSDDPVEIVERERLLEGEYGRLRDVVMGPDGALYVATSNRDGRGSPDQRDDRILRIGPVEDRPLLYPDLRTLPPTDLQFGTEVIEGESRHVLRFENSIWNAGEGPLELRPISETDPEVFQRIYDSEGTFVERLAGEFVFHEAHDHWHFDDFTRFELWTRSSYDAWLESDRTQGEPEWSIGKVSFCIMDIVQIEELPGSPSSQVYPDTCPLGVQGISVGWADVYEATLEEQWIELGPDPLPDGEYVLRSVADPLTLVHESPGGQDPDREGEESNEADVAFSVEGGRIAEGETLASGA